MPADWFEDLMGFKELPYEETRANLEVAGSTLRSKVNNQSYAVGASRRRRLRSFETGPPASWTHWPGPSASRTSWVTSGDSIAIRPTGTRCSRWRRSSTCWR